ncbi:MAG: aldo/keto reductase family oxidoreductase [Candidatus Fimadaptatus sp.]
MKYINWQPDAPAASVIGLGCMRISNMTESAVSALIDAALESGINLFDHADIYGGGESESVFGRVLASRPGLRDRMVIQSKCGIRKGFFDFSEEHIVSSVEGSLKRLGIERLDMLLLHRPDALMEPDEVAGAFERLYTAGKVAAFGVSNQNPSQMRRLQRATGHRLCVNQLQLSVAHCPMIDAGLNSNMHNDAGIDRDGGTLDWCAMEDVTVQCWSPLLYGFFEGNFIDSPRFPELNQKLAELGEKYGASKAAIALAWLTRIPQKVQPIVGSTNPERVRAMSRAGDICLTRPEWYELYRAAGKKLP